MPLLHPVMPEDQDYFEDYLEVGVTYNVCPDPLKSMKQRLLASVGV